ncbi:MAG: hypothetical protein KDB14_11080 [Planctomycetales bacterium]|nr:hypothetical protein [Planctomycetales bacterium]
MSQPMFPVPDGAMSDGASDVKWFAGLAMQAIIAKQSTVPDTDAEREEIALWAYRMGQAMTAMEKQLRVS